MNIDEIPGLAFWVAFWAFFSQEIRTCPSALQDRKKEMDTSEFVRDEPSFTANEARAKCAI